jgi:acyl-CoA dehydrogenase
MRLDSTSPFLKEPHLALARTAAELGPSLPTESPYVLADGKRAVQLMAEAGLYRALEQVQALSFCAIREELASFSGLADSVFAVQGLGSHPIALGGSDALKAELLPAAARGERVFAFALTEPEAGSDAANVRTAARRVGDTYVLDGRKRYISNAGIADHYTVFARTGDSDRRISAFVVDAGTPGFTVGPQTELLAPHPLAELSFEECAVPASRRLGDEGVGLKLALATLDLFRSTVGAAAVGMGRRALAEGLRHAQEREQFGAPLFDLQGVQFLLAESAVELDAARLLVHHAASVKDAGNRVTYEAAVAKLFATEAAQRSIDRSLQVHGGAGVVKGHAVERLYREIRALRIYEGASEVQKLVIARELAKNANR